MPKLPIILSLVLSVGLIALNTGCKSSSKLLDQGDYDEVIEKSLQKLAGKKNKKSDVVSILVDAFTKVTEQDMRAAARFSAENTPENWERALNAYQKIRNRQERILPFLPLVDERGVEAEFQFVRTNDLETEAKRQIMEGYYTKGKKLLEIAKSGNKMAARDAFDVINRIQKYDDNYKDSRLLMDDAQYLGTTFVLFKMVNQAPVVLPARFEEELLAIGVRQLQTKWKAFHTKPQSDLRYDYEVVVNLTDIDVSPELLKEREYEESKEIEEGFEYVLDERGNVKKDTAGNDIKVPKKIWIKARIFEAFQSKAARVGGRLEIVDLHQNTLLESNRFDVESVFENYSSRFQGDERALSDKSKQYCKNTFLPFPTDEALLLDAAEQMKPILKQKVSNSKSVI